MRRRWQGSPSTHRSDRSRRRRDGTEVRPNRRRRPRHGSRVPSMERYARTPAVAISQTFRGGTGSATTSLQFGGINPILQRPHAPGRRVPAPRRSTAMPGCWRRRGRRSVAAKPWRSAPVDRYRPDGWSVEVTDVRSTWSRVLAISLPSAARSATWFHDRNEGEIRCWLLLMQNVPWSEC